MRWLPLLLLASRALADHDPDHKRGALPSSDARTTELSDIRTKLDTMFAHRLEKEQRYKLDEDALFVDAGKALQAATTWMQYDAAIYALLAKFHDGHLSYHPPSTAAPSRGYDPYVLGFTTRLGGDRLFVATAEPDAPVKVGDEITAVDGVAIADVLAREVAHRAWSRPEQAKTEWALTWTSVLYPHGDPPRQRTVTIAKTIVAIAPHARGEKLEKIAVQLDGDLALVRIATMDRHGDDIDAVLAKARGAKAIVMDLRGVRGGVDIVGDRVVADLGEGTLALGSFRALVPAETIAKRPRWKHLVAGADGYSADEPITVQGQPAGQGFHGKLVVMIDAACASTCESVVAALRADLHATLVGETTAGSSGAPVEVKLASGGSIAIPTWNLRSAEGKAIESEGVSPDVIAVPSAKDPDPVPSVSRALVRKP